jgi:hypothetical protein
MLIEYLAWPFLFVLDSLFGYLIPVYCTFRSNPSNERWLIHWLIFLGASMTVLPFLHLICSCTTYWLLKIVIELTILFVVGKYVLTLDNVVNTNSRSFDKARGQR